MIRLLLFFCLPFYTLHAALSALYLSWYEDPTTTMTIQWHCPLDKDEKSLQLIEPNKTKKTYSSAHHPFSDKAIIIHTVTLTNLAPNTTYSFQIGEKGKLYTFQTAPKTLSSPLRFCIGGDLYLSQKLFRKMAQTACRA